MILRDFFDAIDLDQLNDWMQTGREEDLHLDFKLIGNPPFGNRDDRRTLAKALSGFANAEGGVIVWGVDARKNADDVDCARPSQPIQSLPLFVSKLWEYSASATSPSVDGVEHKIIPTS